MTLVIDPKVALLKGVDPVQFCVFLKYTTRQEREVRFLKPADNNVSGFVVAILQSCAHRRSSEFCPSKTVPQTFTI